MKMEGQKKDQCRKRKKKKPPCERHIKFEINLAVER
jgi:hypothetical protein